MADEKTPATPGEERVPAPRLDPTSDSQTQTTQEPASAEKPAEKATAEKRAPQPSLARDLLSGTAMVSVLSVVIGLLVGAVLIAAANPAVQTTLGYFFARPADFFQVTAQVVGDAYLALFRGAVFDWQATSAERAIRPFTESLVAATPLILAGLGIALGFRSGLFNIGGQGQVVLGAIFAGFVGYAIGLPFGVHMLVSVVAAIVGGALWAGIAGFLKARTGANEVIVTIMLNSIAGFLLAYLLKQQWFKHTTSANPQSRVVDDTAMLFPMLPGSFRLHFGFVLAILATIFVWWLLERSTLGFEFRAVGENPHAARTAGISVERVTVLVMIVAGALAGMAGAAQVLGTEAKLTGGIAGSIGFDAITVALLGRSRPLGVFLAGLLFGAFKAGGYLMQSTTGTPIDIVLVVQSVIVLLIAAPPLVRAIFRLPAPARKEKA